MFTNITCFDSVAILKSTFLTFTSVWITVHITLHLGKIEVMCDGNQSQSMFDSKQKQGVSQKSA